MPKSRWPSCFSCTLPRKEGESDTDYRARYNAFLAKNPGPVAPKEAS